MSCGGERKVICAVIVALLFVLPAVASAETYPPYDGSMTFQEIHGPADPEDFSWEVKVGEEEELRLIDDQHAAVYWTDEAETMALLITAQKAHDAEGANVPTTLAISEGKVLTLTVHHRGGNQAAGGASFDYPVSAGAGWDGGFQTVQIKGPPDESELRKPPPAEDTPVPPCEVPSLRGRSLKGARRALHRAHCELGPVRGERSRGAKVVKQYRQAGKALPAGTEVGVKLG